MHRGPQPQHREGQGRQGPDQAGGGEARQGVLAPLVPSIRRKARSGIAGSGLFLYDASMELLAGLGRTLGFSFAAGINLYATVALLGLASRFGWVALPPQFKAFDHDWVIYTAIALYVVEFLADKIPWVDTIWDTLHTFIRPIGGALIAVTTLGEASPAVTGADGASGRRRGRQHARHEGRHARRGQRQPRALHQLAAQSRRRRRSLSGLGFVTLNYPVVALVVVIGLLGLIGFSRRPSSAAFKRRFRRPPRRRVERRGRRARRPRHSAPRRCPGAVGAAAAAERAAQAPAGQQQPTPTGAAPGVPGRRELRPGRRLRDEGRRAGRGPQGGRLRGRRGRRRRRRSRRSSS